MYYIYSMRDDLYVIYVLTSKIEEQIGLRLENAEKL